MQSQEQQPHSLSNRPLLDSSTTSSLPRPSDNLYGTDQMSSNTYYLETLRDSSSDKLSDVPSFSKKLTVNGGASNGATTFRRARAETFSFFPSKLLPEETSAAAPTPSTSSSIMASRHRSGSLSLPRTGISGAFGPSLFATSWQPSSTMNGLVSERPTPSEYASSAGGEDETTAVARTLDYLGLDDPVLENGRHFAQSAQYPQMSRGVVPNSLGSVYANRGRSYSVAVGENLSVSIPTPSTYRPRASSIAFLESTADSDIQALRRSLARGELELEMESPDSENRSDNDRHLSLGRSSPKDYVVYGMDRSFNDSPTRLHHEHAHPHQIPTRSLWIGNIDPTLSPSDLLTLFSPFGPIESLRILPDKECAFVNYVRVEDAIRARDEMQGGRVGNCIVRIGFGKAEAINDTQGMQPTKSLWIGNIPPTTDPAELEALFTAYGPIESARVLTHKNCGFVNFYRLEDAMEARKNMNGKEIGGSVVKIGYAKVPSKSGEGTATLAASALVGTSFMGTASPARDRSNSLSGGFNNFATATGLAATPTPQMLYSPSRAINGAREFGMTPPPPPFPVNLEANVPAISGAAQTGSTRHSIGGGYPEEQMMALALAGAANKELNGMETLDSLWNGQNPNETYASAIPPVPEPKPNRRVDQSRLREMRKRLEGHVTMKDVEAIFNEVVEETVDLCTDYIGNVVIQKIIEKSSDQHRLRLVEKVAPHMAAIGIHKNGTWVVQKMIDYAKTTSQIQLIVTALKPFTPPLLLDQFGNYVVQCCLRLGTHRNQFVFDATHAKCWEVGQGRFGARAMRACLESQYTTKRQQKFVAEAIVHNAIQLATNPNGAI
ncbi:uncharacterized protein SPPG_04340 [Spizellomyces punctatus DAOM BR117]|uniref:PUM-HD domain-containing protein n=1 Tax=Spizellomyces punctatus (strain DAOM BR117) TaxID=645134 RepID=A0A0L0HGF1_SPIPD|nr:uncharacterized protein SPPG_04340 [Spizellomyces punctatus DAOM BR117]KNC99989.1 hypothetical protein SPPG_04340 [Spizellomyces punctatus DAOM BR117]|eukprot:XP_016608029.1 hypothetical protein SPPG_04340 [Spizellomyces punctatus DAOM BR117]